MPVYASRVSAARFRAASRSMPTSTADAVPGRAATVGERHAEITTGRGVNLIPAGFAAGVRLAHRATGAMSLSAR